MLDRHIVNLDKEKLPFREKIAFLLNGGCKSIFPISIIEDSDGIKGFYKISSYKKLSGFEQMSAGDVLTVLEKTIDAIDECIQYLIFPEEFVIDTDTVYTDSSFKNVKFTYVPSKEDATESRKILKFIDELKDITTESGKLYLNMTGELFAVENLSRTNIRAMLMQMKREINICHIV